MAVFCLSIGLPAANAQEQKQVQNATVDQKEVIDPKAGIFKFKEEIHDYGTVPEGPKAECDFEFKNVGKKPITISNAKGSCGCTVPDWPREPILPGKSGKIHVSYNTDGRPGRIDKIVTVTSDAAQNVIMLHITGDVTPKPKPEEPKKG